MADWDVVSEGPAPQGVSADPWAVASEAPAPSVAADVAKQTGAGIVSGVAQMPTVIPRLLGAAGRALEPSIESAVGYFSPSKAADMRQTAATRDAAFQGIDPDKPLNDMLPAPQTTAGQYARAAGEFVPGMMAAPGNLARNALTGAAAGLASEAGGQATAGTDAEPYGRIGGALLGGMASAKALAPAFPKLAVQDVIDAGSAAYKAPEVQAVQIKPSVGQAVSNIVVSDLNRAKFNDRLAPTVHAIVDNFATPINGSTHTLEDFQTARQLLGKVAGNFSDPTQQAAATQAIGTLDKLQNTLPQSALLAGDIGKANTILNAGRADYAAGNAAERVQTKLDNADLQAASAHSGGNIDNATRQKLRTILTSPSLSRGLTPEELDSIDQVVRGSPTGNALRVIGKLLGGGGGLGALITAAEGMHVAGPAGAALPLIGTGVKMAGDAMTRRASVAAVQQILSRAPSAAGMLPQRPPYLDPRFAALLGGMGGAALPIPPAAAPQFPQPQRQQQ